MNAFTVSIYYDVRQDWHLFLSFSIFKQEHGLIKSEIQFVLIENMKGNQIVALEAKMLKRFFYPVWMIVEVRNNYDDPAPV